MLTIMTTSSSPPLHLHQECKVGTLWRGQRANEHQLGVFLPNRKMTALSYSCTTCAIRVNANVGEQTEQSGQTPKQEE